MPQPLDAFLWPRAVFQAASTGLRALVPRFVVVALLVLCLAVTLGGSLPAHAKKKAAGADPAAQADGEVKKGVDPINADLEKLMLKVQSRTLLSPADAAKLADIKYKLLDLMNQYPQNAQLVKPVFQAGVLFNQREAYDDAYELFSFLSQGFATTPYGLKAKGQVQQLEKKFGPGYFTADAAPAGTTASPGATPATPPAKK